MQKRYYGVILKNKHSNSAGSKTIYSKTVIRLALLLPLISFITVLSFISAFQKAAAATETDSGGAQLKFYDDIKEHFFLGGEFFQKNNFNAALIEYNNIRQIDPAYIEGYIYTAKCYFNLKQYIPAAYYAGFTIHLDPSNQEAKTLLEEIKSAAPGTDYKDASIVYTLTEKDRFEEIVFNVYGSSLYLKPITDRNGGKKEFKAGERITLPLDLAIIEGVTKFKKFDGTTLQYDLEVLKESILGQKEVNIKDTDSQALFDISDEYFKINRTYKALVVFEKACYNDAEFIKKKDAAFISKALSEIKDNIKKEPKKSGWYFYLAFLQFVEGNYRDSLSNFSYASSLGLESDLLQRSFKYSMLCKQYIKTLEAKEIEKDAILKASADASLSNKIAEVIKQTNEDADIKTELDGGNKAGESGDGGASATGENADAEAQPPQDFNSMTKEQKMYYCYQQRKAIDEGVQKYNENNIVEMNSETFSFQKLRDAGYMTTDAKCPDGGSYSLNHNGFAQCSEHGL